MDNRTQIQATWRWPALIGLHLLAIGLLASWLAPATRPLWEALDSGLFRLLNGSLGQVPAWDALWAFGSIRPFDSLLGVAMLALLIRGNGVFPAAQVRRAFLHFLVLLALLRVGRVLFSKLVSLMGWQHASPSMVLAGT